MRSWVQARRNVDRQLLAGGVDVRRLLPRERRPATLRRQQGDDAEQLVAGPAHAEAGIDRERFDRRQTLVAAGPIVHRLPVEGERVEGAGDGDEVAERLADPVVTAHADGRAVCVTV